MTFEELVEYVGKQIGHEDFAADEDGVCQIESTEAILSIRSCSELGAVFCTVPIASLEPDMPALFFRKLMAANFMFAKTSGATISIDEEHNLLYLTRYDFLNQMDCEQFYTKVLGLFSATIKFQKGIEDFLAGNEKALDFVEEDLPGEFQGNDGEKVFRV